MRTLKSAKPLSAKERARPAPGTGVPDAAVNRTAPLGFQQRCPHPSARWIHGRDLDYCVCERCGAALDEAWPDHYPEISRWLNEGGAVGREAPLA